MKAHKLLTTASIGALMLGMSTAAYSDNWRYAHEEYEATSRMSSLRLSRVMSKIIPTTPYRSIASASWVSPMTSWSRPRTASCSS